MIAAIYTGTLKRMRSRNRVWVVIVWVTVALARNGWAQPNVDFSGTWTLDAAKSVSPAGIRRGGGTMHIEQTNTELRISTTDPQNGVQTTIVKLDGSDSVSDFFGVGTSTTTATWDGPKLVVRGRVKAVLPQGDLAFESTEVYSRVGSVLTITTTGLILPSGARGKPTTLVFTKQ
jgi:hypothetical protein